eukprot:scaffold1318_cov388-Prasinococcus_capsulatus_cf.AAC.81
MSSFSSLVSKVLGNRKEQKAGKAGKRLTRTVTAGNPAAGKAGDFPGRTTKVYRKAKGAQPNTTEAVAPPTAFARDVSDVGLACLQMHERDFFSEYDEAQRYRTHEIVGKGSYGVVCSATDTRTGQKVAIKKINDVFDHVSDAIRILREIKLLRLLKHPDIVEVRFSRGKPTGGAA